MASICLLAVLIAGSDETRSPVTTLPRCVVSLMESVDVPAREAGQLTAMEVQPGMAVELDDLLALVDDEVPRRQREVTASELDTAQVKTRNGVNVRLARAGAEVADKEYAAAVEVNKRGPGTLSESEVRKRRWVAQNAHLYLEQAEHDRHVAELFGLTKTAELAQIDAAIERRRITAPLMGMVTEVYKRPGEWVQPGERIVRIVRLERLAVEGTVRAADFQPADIDLQPVTVEAKLAHGRRERFSGKIIFVDPTEVDGSYRIRAEVINRQDGRQWLLRPGAKVEMQWQQVDERLSATSR